MSVKDHLHHVMSMRSAGIRTVLMHVRADKDFTGTHISTVQVLVLIDNDDCFVGLLFLSASPNGRTLLS